MEFIKILEQAENEPIFNSRLILDPAKAKCSMRSAIISSYQDKGFIIAGCTNLTEYELGFFMTFGDNLAHFKPIEHLYKTEVIQLAKEIGTRKEVIEQPATSGSVSYTHLDVYKRQLLACLYISITLERPFLLEVFVFNKESKSFISLKSSFVYLLVYYIIKNVIKKDFTDKFLAKIAKI